MESEKNSNKLPLIGEKFPELEVVTTKGKMKLPDNYKGRWFVLFSHPGDFTPVCTTEFVSFARNYEEFKKLNCELIGLSVDQVYSHIKWIEFMQEKFGTKVPFPIIADSLGKMAERLGMIQEGAGLNTIRAVFVVDDKSKIRLILYYPPELGRNVSEVLRIVKGLQIADKNNVAIPANWPNNELIKDDVIVPPASDEKTAEERKGKEGYFDWWFGHKKL